MYDCQASIQLRLESLNLIIICNMSFSYTDECHNGCAHYNNNNIISHAYCHSCTGLIEVLILYGTSEVSIIIQQQLKVKLKLILAHNYTSQELSISGDLFPMGGVYQSQQLFLPVSENTADLIHHLNKILVPFI